MQLELFRSAAPRVFTATAVPIALALLGLTAGEARAEGPRPPIVLALDPCASVDAKEVRRLVPIEMGAPVVGGEGDAGDTTRVTVGCVVDSPSVVRLEVRDPTTGRILDRFITLLGVPKADQARLVAIAAVELVAASRSGQGTIPEAPRVAAAAPSAGLGVEATAPPPPRERRWRLAAVASLRGFGGLPDPVPGGGVAVHHVRRRFTVGGDVLVEGLRQSTALGGVDSLLVSASLVGAARVPVGPVSLEAGGGARGGMASLTGHGGAAVAPVRGGAVSAPWIGPLGTVRAVLSLPRSFALALAGEVGWATAGVVGRVEGAPDISVRGTWWNTSLGVAYAY
jgi:hypothetical protein